MLIAMVYLTVLPRLALARSAVFTMVSPGVRTARVVWQATLPLAAGQVLPTVLELTEFTMVLSPVAGLKAVTEYMMVAVAPTARSPAQVRVGFV